MSYSLAVLDPFNAKAEGARVPDSYSFPTEAVTFRAKYNINCKSDWNKNWFDQVFKASPIDFMTAPKLQGGSAATSFESRALNVSASDFEPSPKPTDYKEDWNRLATHGWLPSSDAEISLNNKGTGMYQWSKYRVVGGGIRMRSQLIPDKATGYFNFYSTETSKVDYSTKLFTSTDFTKANNRALLALHTGRPYVKEQTPVLDIAGPAVTSSQTYGVSLNETMSEEPTGEVLDALSFNSKGVQMSFRPMTAEAYEWRNMTSTPHYTGAGAGEFNKEGTATTEIGFTNAVAGTETEFDESFFKCAGWNTLCVKGSQLPTATIGEGSVTTELPIMVVEVILHVEFISSDIGTTSFARPAPHNPGLLDAVAAKAANMPMYRTLFSGSVAHANRNVRARNGY